MYFHDLYLNILGVGVLSSVTLAYVISAIGLNLHFGYTGLINIGQAGFMLIGSYGFAITVQRTGHLWLGLIVAIALAVAFALLLGVPTLKLRGDYLAIVTLAAAELIRLLGDDQKLAPLTGGTAGIPGSKYAGPFINLSPFAKSGQWGSGPFRKPLSQADSWWLFLVAVVLIVLLTIFVFLLTRSPWGRVLRGIREDEDAVRSLGKNVTLYKMQSLILGGVIGALGGVIYVLATAVSADSMSRTLTFELYTCLLLGGAATVFGPILGTFLYWILLEFIQTTLGDLMPTSVMNQQQVPQAAWVLVGIGLMLLVIFRPQGILGNKKELRFGA
jgi:neutral amino acid transport system permease protein